MDDLERLVGEQLYQTIQEYDDGRSLVMDVSARKLYFKKILQVYDVSVFTYLRDHPDSHVPEIHDFWKEGDSLVVIEELIRGQTLEELLETEDLSFAARRRTLLEICDALIFLHSAVPPIIHRDLKPANVMVTEDGAVKLIDYDAAKTFKGNEKADTFLMGTHGIAAPEQYGFAESDARTDIFALGRLIFRLLPESGSAAKIAEKATKLDPDERYSSVQEVKRLLESVREPVKPGEKPGRPGKYIALIVAFAAGVFAVLVCIHFFHPSGLNEVNTSAEADSSADSEEEKTARLQTLYEEAAGLYDSGDYESAARQFDTLGDFSDAAERALESRYQIADGLYENGDYKSAAGNFEALGDYSDAADRAAASHYQYAGELSSSGEITAAIGEFEKVTDYRDSAQLILDLKYRYCSEHAERPDDETFSYIQDLLSAGCEGASSLAQVIYGWHAEVSWEVSYAVGTMQGVDISAALYGGEDGETISVTFVIVSHTTGKRDVYTPDGTFSRNETASCSLYTSDGAQIIGDTYTVDVYDRDGNIIGTKTGLIELPEWVNSE